MILKYESAQRVSTPPRHYAYDPPPLRRSQKITVVQVSPGRRGGPAYNQLFSGLDQPSNHDFIILSKTPAAALSLRRRCDAKSTLNGIYSNTNYLIIVTTIVTLCNEAAGKVNCHFVTCQYSRKNVNIGRDPNFCSFVAPI